MKYMRMHMMCIFSLLFLGIPGVGMAEDTIGISGDDYIVENNSPDLLGEDLEMEEDSASVGIPDPLEPLNRVFFVFNDKLYFWVLKPVKQGYSKVVPGDVRFVIGNFFTNLASPVSFVNTLLQGRFRDAGVVMSRFLINSTIGVFGFADLAAEEFDLEPKRGDFGETLGTYGIGEGIYLCLPLLGPSDLRDGVGVFVDMQLHPYSYTGFNSDEKLAVRSFEFINRLSITPDVYEELKKIALDPYVASRQAYIDYRRNLILSHGE